VALKLHHIQALLGLHAQAEQQIQLYLTEIENAQREMGNVSVGRRSTTVQVAKMQFNDVMTACSNRITKAEAGITTCRQNIADVQRQIDEYTASTSLTTFDLAYLNLNGK
jgi:chromosome segregation ATPase